MVGVAVTDLKEQLPLCSCGITDVRCVAAGPFFNLEYYWRMVSTIMLSREIWYIGVTVVCSWTVVSNHMIIYSNVYLVLYSGTSE